MDKILIIDYGSQYNMLISRRIREMNVYSFVVPYHSHIELTSDIKGIILSGGPGSVYDPDSPALDLNILNSGIPILGICYGMQLLVKSCEGLVSPGTIREYGKNQIHQVSHGKLNQGLSQTSTVWMSHGDETKVMPQGFVELARSENSVAIIENHERKLYGVQFHPEVTHTTEGKKLLENFVFKICQAKADWNVEDFLETKLKDIKEEVKDEYVMLGLSGGVDSTVCAALLSKAIGNHLTCIFIDTGLLRKDEAKHVMEGYDVLKDLNIIKVDAQDEFYQALIGITDPEEKRKIIGRVFFEVFEREKGKLKDITYLAQGTIYPDVIESISISGAHTIKSHHNVGGMPKQTTFKILEPLKELFKDEVRRLGISLGLSKELVYRHPFPGPGLGIRILGEITKERVKILQEADDIFICELRKNGLYDQVSQAFVVLLPVKTVGVMGDRRTYEEVACIRSVNSDDFMTADFSRLPYDFLSLVAIKIVNEVKGINRVTYDITSKPPGTIEWE